MGRAGAGGRAFRRAHGAFSPSRPGGARRWARFSRRQQRTILFERNTLFELALQHLVIVGSAVGIILLVGLPLGVWLTRPSGARLFAARLEPFVNRPDLPARRGPRARAALLRLRAAADAHRARWLTGSCPSRATPSRGSRRCRPTFWRRLAAWAWVPGARCGGSSSPLATRVILSGGPHERHLYDRHRDGRAYYRRGRLGRADYRRAGGEQPVISDRGRAARGASCARHGFRARAARARPRTRGEARESRLN